MDNYTLTLFFLKVTIVLLLSTNSVANNNTESTAKSSVEGSGDSSSIDYEGNNESGLSLITTTTNDLPNTTAPDYLVENTELQSSLNIGNAIKNEKDPEQNISSKEFFSWKDFPNPTSDSYSTRAFLSNTSTKNRENNEVNLTENSFSKDLGDETTITINVLKGSNTVVPNNLSKQYTIAKSDIESHNITSTGTTTNYSDSDPHSTMTLTTNGQLNNVTSNRFHQNGNSTVDGLTRTTSYSNSFSTSSNETSTKYSDYDKRELSPKSSDEGSGDSSSGGTAGNNESDHSTVTTTTNNLTVTTSPDYLAENEELQSTLNSRNIIKTEEIPEHNVVGLTENSFTKHQEGTTTIINTRNGSSIVLPNNSSKQYTTVEIRTTKNPINTAEQMYNSTRKKSEEPGTLIQGKFIMNVYLIRVNHNKYFY